MYMTKKFIQMDYWIIIIEILLDLGVAHFFYYTTLLSLETSDFVQSKSSCDIFTVFIYTLMIDYAYVLIYSSVLFSLCCMSYTATLYVYMYSNKKFLVNNHFGFFHLLFQIISENHWRILPLPPMITTPCGSIYN